MEFSKSKISLGVALVLAISGPLRADGLVISVVAPAGSVVAGSDVNVGILAANPGESPVGFDPPSKLPARLRQEAQSWPVELRRAPEPGTRVLPGGFADLTYSLTLPGAASGSLILEISDGFPIPLRAVILVRPHAAETASGGGTGFGATAPPVGVSSGGHTAVSQLSHSLFGRLGEFEPIYFIYGAKSPSAKFEFSLKYRLLGFDEGSADGPAGTLQFGFTQRSLWAVNATESAFYDTSYMPSLFYQFLAPAPDPGFRNGRLTWLGLASGYQHESNGQGGVAERSLNTLFVRSGVILGRADRWHAVAAVRIFDYVGSIRDNPEIRDYRGYGDWTVTLAAGEGPSLAYKGWEGRDFNHPTSQFDLNVPVKVRFMDFATYFLVQYFDGYGESLRQYDVHSDTVRGGFSLVR